MRKTETARSARTTDLQSNRADNLTAAKMLKIGRGRMRSTAGKAVSDSNVYTAPSLTAALRAALQRTPDTPLSPNVRKIDLVADALVAKACAGDVQAIKALFERIAGKPGDKPEEPETITIVHSFKSQI